VDYLPEVYRNFTYFQVFNVGHTITPAGWETSITAKMKLDIDKYKQKYGKQFLKDKIDFEKIATEFRTKEQVETARERIDELLTSIDKNNRLIMRYESDIEIHTFEDTKDSTAVEKLRTAQGKAYLVEYNFNNFTYRLTDLKMDVDQIGQPELRELGVPRNFNDNETTRRVISVRTKQQRGATNEKLRAKIADYKRKNIEYQLEIDSLKPDKKGLSNKPLPPGTIAYDLQYDLDGNERDLSSRQVSISIQQQGENLANTLLDSGGSSGGGSSNRGGFNFGSSKSDAYRDG